MNEFSTALKKFQDAQRDAASKEKDSVARARASSGSNYVRVLTKYYGTIRRLNLVIFI